ncbi:MAG TPA: hypothetical protein DDW52_17060 [Planctomycetaceae bacterium]|nr:hypothetical protein [Planctomycetaceae bacterium]
MASKSEIEAGRAIVRIQLGGKIQLSKDLQDVQAQMKSVARNLESYGASTARIGATITAAFGGALASLSFPVKLASDAQTTQASFETLLGSATKTKNLLGELQQFAASTPFQFGELANASRLMLAFGISSQNIVPTLRRIGDVASATGNDVGELARIYGLAKTQGRLFAEDINQLTGRGIPIIAALAKQFGVAESEVRELVREGKVGFAELERAFVDLTAAGSQFGGGMERQSRTFSGVLSTLRDNINAALRPIGESLLPMLTSLGQRAITVAQQIGKWIETNKSSIPILASVLAGGTALGAGLLTLGTAVIGVGSAIRGAATVSGTLSRIWSQLTGTTQSGATATSAAAMATDRDAQAKTRNTSATQIARAAVTQFNTSVTAATAKTLAQAAAIDQATGSIGRYTAAVRLASGQAPPTARTPRPSSPRQASTSTPQGTGLVVAPKQAATASRGLGTYNKRLPPIIANTAKAAKSTGSLTNNLVTLAAVSGSTGAANAAMATTMASSLTGLLRGPLAGISRIFTALPPQAKIVGLAIAGAGAVAASGFVGILGVTGRLPEVLTNTGLKVQELGKTIGTTFQGITAAVSQMDLGGALEIAMQGMKLASLQGVQAVHQSLVWLVDNGRDILVDFAKFTANLMQRLFENIGQLVVTALTKGMSGVRDRLKDLITEGIGGTLDQAIERNKKKLDELVAAQQQQTATNDSNSQSTRRRSDNRSTSTRAPKPPRESSTGSTVSKQAESAAAARIRQLRDEIYAMRFGENAAKLRTLALDGASKSELRQVRALMLQRDAIEKSKQAMMDAADAENRRRAIVSQNAKALTDSVRTPAEAFRDRIREVFKLSQQQAISAETEKRALASARQEFMSQSGVSSSGPSTPQQAQGLFDQGSREQFFTRLRERQAELVKQQAMRRQAGGIEKKEHSKAIQQAAQGRKPKADRQDLQLSTQRNVILGRIERAIENLSDKPAETVRIP